MSDQDPEVERLRAKSNYGWNGYAKADVSKLKPIDRKFASCWKTENTKRTAEKAARLKRRKSRLMAFLLAIFWTATPVVVLVAILILVAGWFFDSEFPKCLAEPQGSYMLSLELISAAGVIASIMDGVTARLIHRFKTGTALVQAVLEGFFATDRKTAHWGPWYVDPGESFLKDKKNCEKFYD